MELIRKKNEYELYDGDIVDIKGVPGAYKVHLYESDLKYVPFVPMPHIVEKAIMLIKGELGHSWRTTGQQY